MAKSIIGDFLSQVAGLFATRKEDGAYGFAPASPPCHAGAETHGTLLLPRLDEERTILGSDLGEQEGAGPEGVLLCRLVPALNAYAVCEAGTSKADGASRIEAYARGGCRYYPAGGSLVGLCRRSYLRVFDLPPDLRARIPALLQSWLSLFENEDGLREFVLESCLANASREEAAVLAGVFAALGVAPRKARVAKRRARKLARSCFGPKNRL